MAIIKKLVNFFIRKVLKRKKYHYFIVWTRKGSPSYQRKEVEWWR